MPRPQALLLMLSLLAGSTLLAACESNEGPLERAGETVDDTVDDAGDAVDDATE